MYRDRILLSLVVLLASAVFYAAAGQTPDNAPKPVILSGEVTSIDASKLSLSTKDGVIEIALSDKTEYKRVSPENPSLKNAVAAALGDISVGDKLAVSRVVNADGKAQPARTVYLITKSDIAQKQAKETERWRTRGIAGRVVSIDPPTGKITVEIRGLVGSSNVVVTPKENVKYLRYAPDSIKYSEALKSSLMEIKAGDMLRAVGDKSVDGATLAAEEIVSGAFQTRAGTVKSVDTVKNEIVVTDRQSNADLTIALIPSSVLKRFPDEMAQRMAQAQMGAAGGLRPAGQGAVPAQQPAAGGAPGQNRPGQAQGGFGGQRAGGIDEMLDRFPNITAADLKAGDVIAVSSTKNGDPNRLTAIKLLAGVEPFLRAAQMAAAAQQGGQQRALDLNIPGLDGFGTP
jgi:hypothetical protein